MPKKGIEEVTKHKQTPKKNHKKKGKIKYKARSKESVPLFDRNSYRRNILPLPTCTLDVKDQLIY